MVVASLWKILEEMSLQTSSNSPEKQTDHVAVLERHDHCLGTVGKAVVRLDHCKSHQMAADLFYHELFR